MARSGKATAKAVLMSSCAFVAITFTVPLTYDRV